MPTKPWWASKTILGAVIALLAPILGHWGVTITAADQADIVELIATLAAAGGFAVTIWGRITADRPLGRSKDDGGTPLGIGGTMVLLLAVGILAPPLGACATREAETPAQTLYGVEADFQGLQRAALAYVTSDLARPEIKARVKDLEAVAYDAIVAARQAARTGSDVGLPAALAAAQAAIERLRLFLIEKDIMP